MVHCFRNHKVVAVNEANSGDEDPHLKNERLWFTAGKKVQSITTLKVRVLGHFRALLKQLTTSARLILLLSLRSHPASHLRPLTNLICAR